MTNEFNEWYEDADIPMQDEAGNWYDAETGIRFRPKKAARAQRKSFHSEIAKANKIKALKGTEKQRAWAEDIREKFLCEMSEADIELLKHCAETHNILNQSKFWIQYREKTVNFILEKISGWK